LNKNFFLRFEGDRVYNADVTRNENACYCDTSYRRFSTCVGRSPVISYTRTHNYTFARM